MFVKLHQAIFMFYFNLAKNKGRQDKKWERKRGRKEGRKAS